jgi:hypothetical protein
LAQPRSSLMVRHPLITAAFVIAGVSFALAQTSPLPAPQTPEAKAETRPPDPDLAKFRSAYTSGDGIAYVVIKDDKGEHIYRYGDASRLTAKRDTRGYVSSRALLRMFLSFKSPRTRQR